MIGLVWSAELGLFLSPSLTTNTKLQAKFTTNRNPFINTPFIANTSMADLASVEKARRELEDLYLGVPDESVNLTFQHLVQVSTLQQQPPATSDDPHPPSDDNQKPRNHLELPNLGVNRARPEPPKNPPGDHRVNAVQDKFVSFYPMAVHGRYHGTPDRGSRRAVESSVIMGKNYDKDDMNRVSGMSMSTAASSFQTGRRRRPGIPHSNICTLCITYIYLFRHRCLVCGRVYCRHCVQMGMGEMAEGRKCVDCLGKRFSLRYIQIAGQTGCWMGYSSTVKQQELKWAEKGPRVKTRNRSSRSIITSTSKSPTTAHSQYTTPSFVLNTPYSPYTPTHHYPLPF